MLRRELLQTLAATVVLAACGSESQGPLDGPATPAPGSGGEGGTEGGGEPPKPLAPQSTPETSDRVFPQGLASGDPRPDRVLLWTRVAAGEAGRQATDEVDVEYVVAEDEALTKVVARGTVKASPDADHTVRVLPVGLEPGRHYYYRFDAGGSTTRVGRTKTAPAEGDARRIEFATASCQDFINRHYHAWHALLDEKRDLDFVLFLGDYVYETVNDNRFQSSTPGGRGVKLPDGVDVSKDQDGSRIGAGTLADYRELYKTYRSDPWLKEVHRLYPFVLTWDDHEFANDCWQDHTTYLDGQRVEKFTERREVANQAWFEFQPADVFYDAAAEFPNDIRIYRKLRFGKHVEIFMTDQRSYRDDHVVPEGPMDLSVGKFLTNSMIGSRMLVRKSGFDTKESGIKPTMLGETQKRWFVDSVKASSATWKVWGNEVQLYEQVADLGQIDGIPDFIRARMYVSTDQWDGYRSERAEILTALEDANVDNLVVCTGDIHAFFAAELHADFAAPAAKPVGVEIVTASITSSSLGQILDKAIGGVALLRPLVGPLVENLNGALLGSNPHLKLSDADANGFALFTADENGLGVELVHLGNPEDPTYAGPVKRQTLRVDVGTNKLQIA